MSDLIFKEGDVGVDGNGFLHGPLARRPDCPGLYAGGRSWDRHGQPIEGCKFTLVANWGPATPPRRPDPKVIAVTIGREEAEEIQHELSDLLCWAAGFRAALSSDDTARLPYGVDAARRIRTLINRSLEKRTISDVE